MKVTELVAAFCLTLGLATASRADVLTLAPIDAAVVAADESGETRVVLLFDVTDLTEASGKGVDGALLEWTLESMTSDVEYTFSLTPIAANWNSDAAAVSAEAIEPADAPVAVWTFEPQDYVSNGGGLVRFEITDLVRSWVKGEIQNFGILITTPDLGASDYSGELAGPRLKIHFGP